MTIRIYIEGGGDGRILDTLFRQGWQRFFQAAGLSGHMPAVVRGGGRTQTWDMFVTAVSNPSAGVVPLLLVDSEGPLAPGHTAWDHIRSRDGWERPSSAGDDQAFLMVQLMEIWFLADRDLLRRYFGVGIRERHFSEWPDLESVSKDTVLRSLDMATAGCRRKYAKGKVSFEVLGQLDPRLVEVRCPHARALLDRLRAATSRRS